MGTELDPFGYDAAFERLAAGFRSRTCATLSATVARPRS